jgi:hypothetical protein
MTHMHWVVRQNKLELPNDEEEVNTRDIHKCDGQAHHNWLDSFGPMGCS